MKIELTKDLNFGAAGTAPAGTQMEVTGERYNGACWVANWNGRSIVVSKQDAREVGEA